jgi:hypothetical protein
MIHPILTSMRFSSSNRNLNLFAQRFCLQQTMLARVATFLRDQLHKCYGAGWEGRTTAMASEPAWLRAVWRWCGVLFVWPTKFPMPTIGHTTKKIVQDPDGSWWCETTFTPVSYPDILRGMMTEVVRSTGLPQQMLQAVTGGRRAGRRQAAEQFMEAAKKRAHEFLHATEKFVEEHPDKVPKVVGGVDWGSGEPRGVMTLCGVGEGGKAIILGTTEIPIRVVRKEHLPEGVHAVIGSGPVSGPDFDPHKFVIVKSSTPKPMNQGLSSDTLILRRPDLLPEYREAAHSGISVTHFDVGIDRLERATDIVFIDGVRQKVIKTSHEGRPYKASYFHPKRHGQQTVVDGRLVTTFGDDEPLGIKAGTLICEPWTEADSGATHLEDDVLGATVTRDGVLFHDQGVYIPRNPNDI